MSKNITKPGGMFFKQRIVPCFTSAKNGNGSYGHIIDFEAKGKQICLSSKIINRINH